MKYCEIKLSTLPSVSTLLMSQMPVEMTVRTYLFERVAQAVSLNAVTPIRTTSSSTIIQ